MKTQQALVDALRAAYPDESAASIARRAKLSQQRFANYVQGARVMDDDAVIGCAALLGWDTRKTLATHHAETAKTDRERAFWRQLGAAATLAGFVLMMPVGYAKEVVGRDGFEPSTSGLKVRLAAIYERLLRLLLARSATRAVTVPALC